MSEENLWGDLPMEEKMETPVSILRTQAANLTRLSSGRLEGRINSAQSGAKRDHELRIVALALGNYSTAIASVFHEVFLYPAELYYRGEQSWELAVTADNASELKAGLRNILQSVRVRRIISALLGPMPSGNSFVVGS